MTYLGIYISIAKLPFNASSTIVSYALHRGAYDTIFDDALKGNLAIDI